MPILKKLFSNQAFIITLIFLLLPANWIISKYAIGYSSDYIDYSYIVSFSLVWLYIIFAILIMPFFINNVIKKGKNKIRVHRIYRRISWLMISIFLSLFVYFLLDEFISNMYHISFFSDLWYFLTRWFRWSVITDTEFGLLYDIKIIALYSPWLMASALFYRFIKISKTDNVEAPDTFTSQKK